jgi:hypothetical protein
LSDIKLIVDIFAEANAAVDKMGTSAFVDALHRGDNTPVLVEIKEALALGQFAELYNLTNDPKRIYARANPRGTGSADFTVCDGARAWSRDLELTSLWEREDNFPHTATEDPNVIEVSLSMPRRPLDELRREITKKIKRDLYKHARRNNYPTYWLAIYANFIQEAYKVGPDYAAKVVGEALIAKPPAGNVERVWVWNPGLHLVFPS